MARLGTILVATGALLATAPAPASADETVLFSFTGKTTGAEPLGGVIFDADGNMYGTTNAGGAHQNVGTVYTLTPNGEETVLHSFSLCPGSGKCVEGDSPQGSLVMDANGNLIGTAASGGAPACVAGTVFTLASDGTETTLHSFCPKGGGRDGEHPRGGLVMDGDGNLFGITSEGGANGFGAAFELFAPDYTTYKLIYSFCSQGSTSCSDGALPAAGIAPAPGLAIDGDGNLYGTASQGGAFDNGDVFELSPTGTGKYKLTVLYSFCPKGNCPDGAMPTSGLLLGSDGNLYGTTSQGGTGNKFQSESAGVIFQLSPNSKNSTETVLYNFCSQGGCADGAAATGSLIMDSQGILYGTAAAGGGHKGGVVFALDPNDGTYTVLYDFCSKTACADGQAPMVITNVDGNLFGTTAKGGKKKKGTVFELDGVASPP